MKIISVDMDEVLTSVYSQFIIMPADEFGQALLIKNLYGIGNLS